MAEAYLEHHRHLHVTGHLVLTVVMALLSAMAFAVAMVVQQRAASESSDRDARGGRFVGQLLRNPRWVAGTLGNGLGYVLQGVALAFGSLLVVQPLLVTALLFALPLGARLQHRKLPRNVIVWGLVLAAALALFVVLGNPNKGSSHVSGQGWTLVVAVGVPIVVLCLIVAHGRSGATRASLLAIAVGLLGGVLAVLTKAVVGALEHGVLDALTTGETYGLVVVGAVGIYVQQLSFQAGALEASMPIILVLEPIVAAIIGIGLLHEKLRVTGPKTVVLAVLVVAMILATVALARDEAHETAPVS